MKFVDLFAGIGGFRKGMELAGHKCVGFCEWDKFAAASYISMHLLTNEQRAKLATIDIKQRQKEILKEEYRNGEWYSSDVRLIKGDSIPKADCWCFGAPCQDFSVAGRRAGLDGDRSSLVREVFRILAEIAEEDRPEWLIYENVKGMLSSNRGADFAAIILEMGELGYDIEWELFNSKNFGVPQNRERVYTVGHLRSRGRKQIFPLKGTDGEDSVFEIEPAVIGGYGEINFGKQWRQGNRVYDGNKIATALCANPMGNLGGDTCLYGVPMFGIDKNVQGQETKYAKATDGEDSAFGVKQIGQRNRPNRNNLNQYRVYDAKGVSPCLNKMDGGGREPHVVIPVLTPEKDENTTVYAVWYEKYQCYIAIRKLTPKECFRLQGWTDDYFEKASFINSDSQLYKQAGNGVTVNVVAEIGYALTHATDKLAQTVTTHKTYSHNEQKRLF